MTRIASSREHESKSRSQPSAYDARMSRAAIFACMLVAGGLVAQSPALASCGIPEPVLFAPTTGTRLPSEPTIYLFVHENPSYSYGKLGDIAVLDGKGLPLAFQRESLPGTSDILVVRLKVAAKSGAAIVRTRVGEMEISAAYRIDGKAGPPTKVPYTEIVNATYLYNEICRGSNGFILHVRPLAPAYRVEEDGKVWVVPYGDDGDDWQHRKGGAGTIFTGRIDCSDFVIPTDKPLALRITPLFTDGREGVTRWLGCRKPRNEEETCSAPAGLQFSGRTR